MSDAIDGLNIEFTGDGSKAETNLDALADSLTNLQAATTRLGRALDGADFDRFGEGVKKLAKSLTPLSGFKSQAGGLINSLRDFTDTAERFNQFTGFDKFATQVDSLAKSLVPLGGMRSQLGATLRQLENVPQVMETLEASAPSMATFGNNITQLAASLAPLGNVTSKLGAALSQLARFTQVLQQMQSISSEMGTFSTQINQLVSALVPLGTVESKMGATLGQLSRLPAIIQDLSASLSTQDVEGMVSRLVQALAPLGQLTAKGNIIPMLGRFSTIAEDLAKIDLDAFTAQIQKVTAALRPLATEMEKVARGFDAFPAKIQRIIRSNDSLARSHTRVGSGMGKSLLRTGALVYAFRKLLGYTTEAFIKSNQYVENLHLFRLSMDAAAESAFKYGEAVQEAIGIDLAEWMRYQAVFQNMAKGFGIASDKAAVMSKNLTQLGYDLASVFNVPFDTAMEKLESALAGQPRPMREWGFDISETTLKMVALNQGIEKNVETMSQMEKAQLRFVQIMETSRTQGYLGDMARTLMTPANAFRILNQQLIQLQRAFGDLVIPLLIQVVPYLIAVTKALTELSRSLALVLGFELPVIDYSGVDQMRATESAVDEVTESLKRLKSVTAGFDELNIISDSAAASMKALGDDLGLNLSKYDYDFLGGATSLVDGVLANLEPLFDRVENAAKSGITWVRENFEELKQGAIAIGVIMASWKISTGVLDVIKNVKNVQSMDLTLMLSGATLLTGAAFAISYNGINFKNLGSALLAAVAAVGGSLLLLGTGALGWTVGLGIVVAATIGGFMLANKRKTKDLIKKAFYESDDRYILDNMKVSLQGTQFSFQGSGLTFLDELTSSFGDKIQGIVFQTEGFAEGDQEVGRLEKAINTVNLEIEKTKNLWDAGLISGENYTAQMIVLLDQFLQESASRFRAIRDNIYAALTGPLGAALEATGASLPAVMNIVSSVAEHATDQLTLAVNELIELEKRKGSLTEAENQRLLDLYAQVTTDPFKKVAQGLQSQLAGVPLGGLALGDTVEAIRKMGSMFVSAENELSNLMGTFISHVSALRDVAPPEDREQLDTLIKQSTQAGTLMRQDLGVIMNDALTEVFKGIGLAGAKQMWEAYAARLNEGDDKVLAALDAGNELEALSEGLKSTFAEMEKAAKESGFTLALPPISEFREYMIELFDRGVKYTESPSMQLHGPSIGSTSLTSLEDYQLAPSDLQELLVPVRTDYIGKQLIIGFREGIESEMDAQELASIIAGGTIDAVETQLGIASPSKVFIEIGRQVVEGFSLGLAGVSELTRKGLGLGQSVIEGFTLALRPMSQILDDQADKSGVKGFDQLHDLSLVADQGKGKEGAVAEVRTLGEEIKRVIDEASSRVIPEGLRKINTLLEKGAVTSFGTISTLADKTLTSVYGTFVEGQLEIMSSWEGTPGFFRDAIFKPLLVDSTKLLNESLTRFKQTNGLVKMSWTDLVDWIKGNPLKEMGASIGKALVNMSDQFSATFSDMVMNVEWLKNTFVNAKNPIMNVLGEIIRELIRMAAQKAFLALIGSLFGGPAGAMSAVAAFASGGFPMTGSLFVAREAGPELVGTIGSRSAVVNNDQIVQSVSKGVYEAVLSAMGGQRSDSDRPIEVRVSLDGKEITRSVERVQRERGADIMPGGLMYGY